MLRVRGAACAVALGAALSMSGAAAATPPDMPGAGSVTATLSSSRAGARPVVLTLAIRMELQCGRLLGGTLVVHLPAQERVPPKIAAAAVTVGGKPTSLVVVAGHVVTVSVPRPTGMTCMVIGPGTVTLVLSRAANLGNPKAAGKYALVVSRGTQQFKTQLAIS